jgi:hypothetical protein
MSLSYIAQSQSKSLLLGAIAGTSRIKGVQNYQDVVENAELLEELIVSNSMPTLV